MDPNDTVADQQYEVACRSCGVKPSKGLPMAALLIRILEEIDAGRDVAPVLDAEDIGQLLPTDVEAANLPRTGARLRQAVDEAEKLTAASSTQAAAATAAAATLATAAAATATDWAWPRPAEHRKGEARASRKKGPAANREAGRRAGARDR